MTREEFIKILDDEGGYSYVIEGDKIIVTGGGFFPNLKTIPSGVQFNNNGDLYFNLLKTIPSGVGFNNKGDVYLNSIKTIPTDVRFNNRDRVYMELIIGNGDYFHNWKGNIEGINSKRLLNGMIKRGIFS